MKKIQRRFSNKVQTWLKQAPNQFLQPWGSLNGLACEEKAPHILPPEFSPSKPLQTKVFLKGHPEEDHPLPVLQGGNHLVEQPVPNKWIRLYEPKTVCQLNGGRKSVENVCTITRSVSVFVTHGHDWRPLGDGRKRRREIEVTGTMAYCLSCRRNQSVC